MKWRIEGRRRLIGGMALALGMIAPSQTQTAIANGDTRTLYLRHSHTGESIAATFRVNGAYDPAVLERLNWFLRDWRNNDTTKMDPRLFDVVWEVYRTAGATDPIVIFSAYRSPATNAMLRRRSSGVAEFSQHMVGKAMDTTMPGMSMERIREIGIKLQRGGVGYYAGSNFVHLDVGNVRSWPRLSYDRLARLFPDGKSVHLASNGQALPRYEEARAELGARGYVAVAMAPPSGGGFFSWLFGGGRDAVEDVEPARPAATRRGRVQTAALGRRDAPRRSAEEVAVYDGGGTRSTRPETPAERRNMRSGEPLVTVASLTQAGLPEGQAKLAKAAPPSLDVTPVARPNFEESSEARTAVQDKAASQETIAAAVPLPPTRPQDRMMIAKTFGDVPEPPVRPGPRTKVASIASLDPSEPHVTISASPVAPAGSEDGEPVAGAKPATPPMTRASSLPVVITRGPSDQPSVPAQVLAYAPTIPVAEAASESPTKPDRAFPQKPVPAPQTPTTPSRLDRSNFRSLTAGTATASLVTQTLLGPSVAGLRQAARITPDILSPLPSIGYVATFGATATDLDCAHFQGAATKPLAAAPGLVRILESSLRLSGY